MGGRMSGVRCDLVSRCPLGGCEALGNCAGQLLDDLAAAAAQGLATQNVTVKIRLHQSRPTG